MRWGGLSRFLIEFSRNPAQRGRIHLKERETSTRSGLKTARIREYAVAELRRS
jgi:hypothetical protein